MANIKKIKNGSTVLDIKDAVSTYEVAGLQRHLDEVITKDELISALGIGSAIHFVGSSTTDPKGTSGATVAGHTNWQKGDVIIYGQKEYILTGDTNVADNWTILGDEGSFALKTVTITGSGALEGGGTLEANREITHKAYDAIDVKDKNVFVTRVSSDGYGHLTGAETGFLETKPVKLIKGSISAHDTPTLNKETVGSASGWDAGTMFSASYEEEEEALVLTPGTVPTLTVNSIQVGTSLTEGTTFSVPTTDNNITLFATGNIKVND